MSSSIEGQEDGGSRRWKRRGKRRQLPPFVHLPSIRRTISLEVSVNDKEERGGGEGGESRTFCWEGDERRRKEVELDRTAIRIKYKYTHERESKEIVKYKYSTKTHTYIHIIDWRRRRVCSTSLLLFFIL